MTRALILLLCWFVPVSVWRKAIRSKFVGPISRPKRMRLFNKIADWKLDDVDGVKVGTGVTSTIPDYPSAGTIKLPAQIKDAAAEIRNIIARHPGKRVVVKCDCEGGEKEIFARLDAENVLPHIDCVMMEYHHNYDEFIEQMLDKRGFVYFKSSPHSSVGIIRAVNGSRRQSNAAVSGKG